MMFIFLGVLLTYPITTVESNAVSGELYSSLTNMNDLFVFDSVVGKIMPYLPSYLPEVKRYKESYACLTKDTSEIGQGNVLNVAITGNPLHLFAVIKRLVLYWPSIKKSINVITDASYNCTDTLKDCDWWAKWSECEHNPSFMMINCQLSCGLCGKPEIIERLSTLHEVESRTVLPSMNDLRGASLALARLQQVYRLPIPYLAEGKIMNVTTCVSLGVYDCLRIANESHYEGEYANAWQWYHYAGAVAGDPELKAHIQSLKIPVAIQHDANYEPSTPRFFPAYLANQDLQVGWDTRYSKLCRGLRLMDEKTRSGFKCHVSSRGSPYLILQPAKYEHLHNDPEMYMFHDVISDKEIQAIKDTGRESLSRSTVITSDNPVEVRVSQTAWLHNNSHPYLPMIAKRISAITGLHVFEGFPEDMPGEPLQVLSYGIGGHYNYHMDPLWKSDIEENWENYREKYDHFPSGDRIATWMFYLSEVQAGGRTAFPIAGISVEPVKGAAVFWYSIRRNGQGNPQSEHGGCPVLLGHKWVANKWIRENPNFLRRPCSLNANE